MTREEWDYALFLLTCAGVLVGSITYLFAQWLLRREAQRGDPQFREWLSGGSCFSERVRADQIRRGVPPIPRCEWTDPLHTFTGDGGSFPQVHDAEIDWYETGRVEMRVGGLIVPPDIADILIGPTAPEPNEQ